MLASKFILKQLCNQKEVFRLRKKAFMSCLVAHIGPYLFKLSSLEPNTVMVFARSYNERRIAVVQQVQGLLTIRTVMVCIGNPEKLWLIPKIKIKPLGIGNRNVFSQTQ